MAVNPVGPLRPPAIIQNSQAGSKAGVGDFGQAIEKAVGALQQLQTGADATATQLAVGGDVDIHDAMIAMEEASLGFQLVVQVRNKAIDAYQEIMRMQM